MSSGLGELFVELGTIGNVKDLEKFVAKVKEGATAIEKHMKVNDQATKSADVSLKGLISKVGRFKVALTATIYLINRFTNELVRSNQEFLRLTRQTDIALDTFNKWDKVGKMFGIQNMSGQIENLNKRLFELRLTGQGARGFQLAGINPMGMDAEGVLESVRARIQGMNNTQASYILEQMGLDPSLITILRLGKDEFESLWRTVKRYNLTGKERREIERLNIQLQICAIKLAYIKDKIILAIMPIWTKLVQSFTRITDFIFNIGKLVQKISEIKVGVKTLGQVISSILVPALGILLAATHPVWAALMAIYLIVDDFVAYLQGKDSLIGHFINAIADFQDKLNFETPKWIQDLLALVQNLTDLKEFGETLKNIKDGVKNEVSLPKLELTALKLQNPSMMLSSWLGAKAAEWGNSLTNNTKNSTINMTNTIYTDQPAETIQNEVIYLQYMDR